MANEHRVAQAEGLRRTTETGRGPRIRAHLAQHLDIALASSRCSARCRCRSGLRSPGFWELVTMITCSMRLRPPLRPRTGSPACRRVGASPAGPCKRKETGSPTGGREDGLAYAHGTSNGGGPVAAPRAGAAGFDPDEYSRGPVVACGPCRLLVRLTSRRGAPVTRSVGHAAEIGAPRARRRRAQLCGRWAGRRSRRRFVIRPAGPRS